MCFPLGLLPVLLCILRKKDRFRPYNIISELEPIAIIDNKDKYKYDTVVSDWVTIPVVSSLPVRSQSILLPLVWSLRLLLR